MHQQRQRILAPALANLKQDSSPASHSVSAMNQIISRQTNRQISTSSDTTRRVTEVAPLAGPDLTRLQRLTNALERTPDGRWQMPETALIAADERRWLEGRLAILQQSMLRANREAIAAAVSGMLLRFPPTGQAGDLEGRITAFVVDLQEFPLWAIERAVAGLRGQYAPANNLLVEAVRQVLVPTLDEASKVQRLLTADVYHVPDEAERKRISAGFREMAAEFGVSDHDPERVKADANDALLKMLSAPRPRIMLSAEALKTCGIEPRAPEPAAPCPRCIVTSGGAVCVSDCPRRQEAA